MLKHTPEQLHRRIDQYDRTHARNASKPEQDLRTLIAEMWDHYDVIVKERDALRARVTS